MALHDYANANIRNQNPNGTSTKEVQSCVNSVFGSIIGTASVNIKFYKCPGLSSRSTQRQTKLKSRTCSGAFNEYRGIKGFEGKLLGVWSVLMQVRYSGLFQQGFFSDAENDKGYICLYGI